MKVENLKKLSEIQFRRLTGVRPKTFATMVEIIKEADKLKKALDSMDPGSLPGMTKITQFRIFSAICHAQTGFKRGLII